MLCRLHGVVIEFYTRECGSGNEEPLLGIRDDHGWPSGVLQIRFVELKIPFDLSVIMRRLIYQLCKAVCED